MPTIRRACFRSSSKQQDANLWPSLASDVIVSRMESSPTASKPPLAITAVAFFIITVCLFASGVTISWLLEGGVMQRLGICLITYPMLVAWQQYVGVFCQSRKAAAVTAILGGIVGVPTTLLLLATVPWYVKIAYKDPSTADWRGFITLSVIAVTAMACLVCNWIWYQQLKSAQEEGTATKPREKFTLGELMWLIVAVSFALAVSSFWHRTYGQGN